MEYIIYCQWDAEAEVWFATNDQIPIALESESLDKLMERVRMAAPEIIELNALPKAKYLSFVATAREEVSA